MSSLVSDEVLFLVEEESLGSASALASASVSASDLVEEGSDLMADLFLDEPPDFLVPDGFVLVVSSAEGSEARFFSGEGVAVMRAGWGVTGVGIFITITFGLSFSFSSVTDDLDSASVAVVLLEC